MARILIIDDEEMVASTLKILLTIHGHEVTTSSNGRAGLGLFVSSPRFDLVITDINMPEVGGIELIRALRTEAPTVGIIAISGGGRNENDLLCMARNVGANEIIQKPFAAEAIISAVNETVAR